MTNLLTWLKQNKLTSFLILIVLILLWRSNSSSPVLYNSQKSIEGLPTLSMDSLSREAAPGGGMSFSEPAPTPEATNRLVVRWSNLSLQVKDVAKALASVKTYAEGLGGYMVDSSTSSPKQVVSGNITIRVPSAKLDETLTYLRGLAVLVVSERLTGQDVTDQYVDTAARLTVLNKTKARFEELSQKAVTFSDIMEANRQILSIQDQIDALNGQQKYLEKTAEMAKITVYLSTDEYSLPYSPATPWRPDVTFKEAVRSLVTTLRGVAGALIWLAVYSVVLLPLIVVVLVVLKFLSKPKPQN